MVMAMAFGGQGPNSHQGHRPVLLRETIELLAAERGGLFVDCTVGLGGHSEAILQASSDAQVLGIDRDEEALGLEGTEGEHDELFEEALRICVEMKRASTSVLQRRLRIGYGRAAAILDMMEREGLIGQADGSRPRPVLGRAYEMVADWDEMAAADV